MDSSAPATVPSAANDVTGLLIAWSDGNQQALDTLVPLIYNELRRIARRYMRHDSGGQTLETTALVHEAYLRLANQKEMTWRNRAHFFAVSAQSMRHILVDMARGRGTQRRGSGAHTVSLEEALVFSPERATALVALDDALTALAQLDGRKSRIVEMRFFGGLTIEETAEVLNISPETVTREWRRAKAWMQSELGAQPSTA
jgi:RNA polymerase sigma-70 factor (ECF subfamily)